MADMKKHSDANVTTRSRELFETWEEGTLIQWLSRYGLYLLTTILGLILLLFLVYRFSPGSTGKAENDYLNADYEFSLFEGSDPSVTQDSLNRLQAIMQRHPELHAKYDALIAQTLLYRNQNEEALPFANSAIARTQVENQPFYTEYAEATLLIASKQYREALNNAQQLRLKMLDNAKLQESAQHPFGDTLFAFNLIRIGMLQQQLGMTQEEMQTWKEWKGFLNNSDKTFSSAAFQEMLTNFSVGTTSILNYMETREKQISQ